MLYRLETIVMKRKHSQDPVFWLVTFISLEVRKDARGGNDVARLSVPSKRPGSWQQCGLRLRGPAVHRHMHQD